MLLRQLHQDCTAVLLNAGIAEPRREAALLLAHFLKLSLTAVYTRPEQTIATEQAELIRQAVQRRSRHEPLAYLLGEIEFSGLAFQVGPGVLVPRPDSEILVETAWSAAGRLAAVPLQILDVCTGTGCIGISLAVRCRQAGRPFRLRLTDLDPLAAGYARRNLRLHRLDDSSDLSIADLWPAESGRRWDLIVANPPYIRQTDIPDLMPEVGAYEPGIALDGGPDGLVLLRRLIAGAAGRLNPGGCLLLEHGYDQAAAAATLFQADGRYLPIPAVRDFGGQPRVSGGWLR